jgi:hypothetical protein
MMAQEPEAWIDSWTPPSEMVMGEWCENAIDEHDDNGKWMRALSGRLIGMTLDDEEDRSRELFFRMKNGDIWVGHWSAEDWENDDPAEACFCLAYQKDGVLTGIGGWHPLPYQDDLAPEEIAEIRRRFPDANLQDPARIYLEVTPYIHLGDVY